MTDFAAIDFETANEYPSSVCSVGVVIVRGGEITETFYSLIHPEPEYYQWFCKRVHGLCEEDTWDAPVFPFVWEKIAPLIEGLPLVAHNARFDEGCLKAVFRVYRMDYPDYIFMTRWQPPAAILVRPFQTISYRRSLPHADTISLGITTHWPTPKLVPG